MNVPESTRGDIKLCQRCRAKVQAESAGRIPYSEWVVLYPIGGPDLPERPESRSVARQLRSDVAESVDGALSRALGLAQRAKPFFNPTTSSCGKTQMELERQALCL